MKAVFSKYTLSFKQPGGTSRGVLQTKDTYFLKISDNANVGIGECGVFRGLSVDDTPNYEQKLKWLCDNINVKENILFDELNEFPSIVFGLEQALLSIKSENIFELLPSKFTKGMDRIPINGLIWMGDKSFMQKQIKEKLKNGFSTIKLKIGAIDFNSELELLKVIRKEYSVSEIELRVDANGAFHTIDALEKLKQLSDFDLHSIEQPIKANQGKAMAKLCAESPLPIALDEDLIGIFNTSDKKDLLQTIKPQYIILKPSLIGGFRGTDNWIKISKDLNVGWWITSALESNIGLNSIAQYTYKLKPKIPQGLGTGGLFTNNILAPLYVKKGSLYYKNIKECNQWGDY